MHILLWIISGVIAGWLTGLIMKGRGYGLVGDLIIGVLGGVLGGSLSHLLGLPLTHWSGWLGMTVTAVIGGIVLVAVARMLRRMCHRAGSGSWLESALSSQTMRKWRDYARKLKTETYALYLAYRDPRVPWYARLFAACVVAYAFSPIDLIPDLIPVLGYLDDLVLIPLGLALVIRMIPPPVLEECRLKARMTMSQGKPTNWVAAGVIVFVWLLLAGVTFSFIARVFGII